MEKVELITIKERLEILNKLINKSCSTCTNISCRVPSQEKVGLNEFGKPQGSECVGWSNEEILIKSKKLGIYDVNKLL